jgi:site-specific recombinase XerD
MPKHFLAAKTAAGLSPRTISTYSLHVGHFVAWLDGRAITRPIIRAYLTDLSATKSPVTVSNYIRDVSVYCAWLVEEGILDINPTTRLKPKVPKRRPASYGKRHITALLDGADPRTKALIIVLLDTGLRVGELVSMTQDSVDMVTGHFTVIGKGNKERSGWMSAYALIALRAYLVSRDDADAALWRGKRGALTESGVYQIIKSRAEAAGIRGELRRLIHGFRATFAKFYIRRGGDLESLRRLLGHESIAMSAHYAQLADDELGEHKAHINPLAGAIDEAA